MEVGTFISGTIGATICTLIVLNIAIPTINSASADISDETVKTMVEVIPLLLVVAIITGIVYMFIVKRKA